MNLRSIYMICKNNYDVLDMFAGEETSINARRCVRISGWNKVRNALIELREAASLNHEANTFINAIPDLYRHQDEFIVSVEEWGEIKKAKNALLRTMDDTMDLCEKMGMDTNDRTGIDIKLPKYHDFSEFVKYVNDIEFVLTKCPFLKTHDETLTFDNVDLGSTWLTFCIIAGSAVAGGSVLLNNIVAFVDKCIVIRSHYLTLQKQKHELEQDQRAADEKATISKYLDEMYEKQVDMVITDLEEITKCKVKNEDGDEMGRINLCFEKMGELIDKGLQIRSSVDAPKEAQALFKPLEMKYLQISNSLKLLENKDENEKEE